MQHQQLAFVGTSEDKPYLHLLKPLVGHVSVKVLLADEITTWTQLKLMVAERGCTGILSTNPKLLAKLTFDDKAKLSNYAGSYFERDGIEIVFLNPLQQIHTVPYGRFLAQRYINKLVYPDRWMKEPEFTWEIARPDNVARIYDRFLDCDLIAVDTETFKENLAIRCVGYCGVWITDNSITTHTVVIPLDELFFLTWMRKFNNLPAAKILQNGKYDHAYFFRYNSPVHNWLWDTANCMHSWYSELPKDLGFLGPFFRRTGRYWKDLAETAANIEEYYLYNARDCYNTALVFLSWVNECPRFARQNYVAKFPVNFPCHMGEMRGIASDPARRREESDRLNREISEAERSLERMIDVKGFNSNSHIQVKQLLTILGCADIAAKSSDEKSLEKAMFRHPLNRRILQKILDIRGMRKLQSTYFPEHKFYKDRLLYAITPYGTDTGRAASGESPYWCGYNIQNIPAYTDSVKRTLRADDGFAFGEADFSQAETRGSAVLTGDEALLAAINSGKDFHSLNASAFFGRPYDSIYDDATGKKLDKALRDLAKRVNHGANYLMMADVLVDTMGLQKIFEAAKLLGLPTFWDARDIASYLLKQFELTYPTIRKDHPAAIIAEIKSTGMLVGPTGWTRVCFGDPTKSKLVLNSYTAHRAQSLNAMILDMAYMNVFYNIAMNPKYAPHFKLQTQIHDSILFQYRIGHEYLGELVAENMRVPVDVTDIRGVTRELVVPVDVKMGTKEDPALYWADTGD